MYKAFFHLSDEPFRMTPDTRYLFHSRRHEEAISSLIYGISQKKGFIVITGDIGTGKTTLCRALLNQLDPKTRTAVILNPSLSRTELLHAILDDLGIDLKEPRTPTPKMLLDRLNEFLIEQAKEGGNVAVIIDEAQNLDPDVLEFIRLLSNLETEQEKLLQIILIGQPELNEVLQLPKLEQLRQRIAVRYHITPLGAEEIPRYIRHRLGVAGNEAAAEFRADAITEIASYTRGTPRLINIICDKCLLAAYAANTRIIDKRIARAAIADHEGIVGTRAAETRGAPALVRPRRSYARPAGIALGIALGLLLVAALATRFSRPAADPVATPLLARALGAAPAPAGRALDEILRAWGARADAADLGAAGMAGVRVTADLPHLARLNLPALIRSGDAEFALVGVTPMSYVFYDPAHALNISPGLGGVDDTYVTLPRMLFDRAGAVDAIVPLPAEWAYTGASATDPRLPRLLTVALTRLAPGTVPPGQFKAASAASLRHTISTFQAVAGIPVDGIVGPLTWCALVAQSENHYPALAR